MTQSARVKQVPLLALEHHLACCVTAFHRKKAKWIPHLFAALFRCTSFKVARKQESLPRLQQPGELDSPRMESGYVVRILDARNAINKINGPSDDLTYDVGNGRSGIK